MKIVASLPAIALPLLVTACGDNGDFQGRYTDENGVTTYEFLPDAELRITGVDDKSKASYEYDDDRQEIKLSSNDELPAELVQINDDGSLSMGEVDLKRVADYSMLLDSTWIGHQGPYTFAMTFSQGEEGLAAFSELVSYDEPEKTYLYQPDDSIARLKGDKLLLDMTQYTLSEVTDKSMKLSIGDNSMVIKKYPKGTKIEFRDGYTSESE